MLRALADNCRSCLHERRLKASVAESDEPFLGSWFLGGSPQKVAPKTETSARAQFRTDEALFIMGQRQERPTAGMILQRVDSLFDALAWLVSMVQPIKRTSKQWEIQPRTCASRR